MYHCRMVDLLIEHGADVNMQNGSGKDALMLSCFAGHLDVVRRLLSHGASWEKKDLGGSTALHWAVDGGLKEIVQWAVMDGCKVGSLTLSLSLSVPLLYYSLTVLRTSTLDQSLYLTLT